MKIRHIILTIAAAVVLTLTGTSCQTSTRVCIDANVPEAEIYIDGTPIGTTPVYMRFSNGVWENPDVLVKKAGYNDLHTELYKEIKYLNCIVGCTIWAPSLLWVYGPKKYQYFNLIPKTSTETTAAVYEPEE